MIEQRELSIFLVVLAVAVFPDLASPNFLSRANLTALVLGLSFNGIMAVGMTILLISGGFDLSIGATLGPGRGDGRLRHDQAWRRMRRSAS